jgi:ubiquinone/menaquinone biosynthesis C-methylase UbiE
VSGLLKRGERALDVGVGSGQFINALAMSGAYSHVVGLDITTHSKFIRQTDAFEMKRMNVADLQFDDGSFDAVICMEVLEHVNRPTFLAGLKEIRRVCRGQLIMTVPFEEPEPLPRYHKQRFDRAAICDLWPTAVRQLLRRPGVSWALMEEHLARRPQATSSDGVQ